MYLRLLKIKIETKLKLATVGGYRSTKGPEVINCNRNGKSSNHGPDRSTDARQWWILKTADNIRDDSDTFTELRLLLTSRQFLYKQNLGWSQADSTPTKSARITPIYNLRNNDRKIPYFLQDHRARKFPSWDSRLILN